jgi:hypothetical protein
MKMLHLLSKRLGRLVLAKTQRTAKLAIIADSFASLRDIDSDLGIGGRCCGAFLVRSTHDGAFVQVK